ncbi:hypothetical protein BD410DRAFT_266526 [Rickenella mellea]|uniref:Ubiquitin-like protease family profile domain-containing protein n=1 Tax=Rickenella mellea TaxID=50990 RepID=A0A4Y7Q462_9AGAM|nr:hypothetical protein BD410DRAFT_266526 [Rickenella mellea]
MHPRDRDSLAELHSAANGFGHTSSGVSSRWPTQRNGIGDDSSASSANPHWQKKPTMIQPPTNPGGNPFGRALNDTFSLPSRPATRTLTGSTAWPRPQKQSTPPKKKRKTEPTTSGHSQEGRGPRKDDPDLILVGKAPSFLGGSSNVGTTRGKDRKGKGKQATDLYIVPTVKGAMSADLTVDDEDIGEVVVRPTRAELVTEIAREHNILVDNPDHPFRRKGPSADGESTNHLRDRLGRHREVPGRSIVPNGVADLIDLEGEDADPIEDADDFGIVMQPSLLRPKSPNGQTSFTLRNVQNKVATIEERQKPTHLDLMKVSRPNRVSNMKAKDSSQSRQSGFKNPFPSGQRLNMNPKPPSSRNKDSVATSSTPFTVDEGAWSALPIEVAIIGATVLNREELGEQWFLWKKDTREIAVDADPRKPTDRRWTMHPKRLESLKHSDQCEQPVIQLKIDTDVPKFVMGRALHGFDGYVSFKFIASHTHVLQHFHNVVTDLGALTSSKEVLKGAAVKAMWESALQNANLSKVSLSNGFTNVDKAASDGGKNDRASQIQQENGHASIPENSRKRRLDVSDGGSMAEPDGLGNPPKPRRRPQPKPAYGKRSLEPTHPTRRSNRQIQPAKSPSPPPDEIILVYPPSGPGAVNVCNSDVKRLRPGEYLNDTLIELGLKFYMNDLRLQFPDIAEKTHIFSSFFYKKLNSKNVEDGYQSLRKWTAKFDIFKKKYIIVPINEHLHWYLAIIHNPEHILDPPAPKPVESTNDPPLPSNDPPDQFLSPPDIEANRGARTEHTTRGSSMEVEDVIRGTQDCSLDDIPRGSLEGGGPPIEGDVVGDSEDEDSQVDQLAEDDEPPPDDSMNIKSDDLPIGYDIRERSTDSVDRYSPMDLDNRHVGDDGTVDGNSGPPSPRQVHSFRDHSSSLTPQSSEDLPDGLHEDKDARPAIPPESFYQQKPTKPKASANTAPFPLDPSSENAGNEEDAAEQSDSSQPEQIVTSIFTLDSLNSRHPQALKMLKAYLQMEAKDKKGIDLTSDPIGKQVLVPVQPNYCDCGLYLLQFAKTFMLDPERIASTIMTQRKGKRVSNEDRQKLWKGEEVANLREHLATRIHDEAEKWRKQKATKEGDNEATGDNATGGAKEAEGSDDDIVMGDIIIKKPAIPAKQPGKKKAASKESVVQPAPRLRG